jgi:hypothetical protein
MGLLGEAWKEHQRKTIRTFRQGEKSLRLLLYCKTEIVIITLSHDDEREGITLIHGDRTTGTPSYVGLFSTTSIE